MKAGLFELFSANAQGLRLYTGGIGSNYVGFQAPSSIASSFNFITPNAPPPGDRMLVVSSAGVISYQTIGGGGSVTSVDVTGISGFIETSGGPITTNGAIALALATQTANTVFAGPTSGGAATPAFRALAYGDLSSLVGTGSNTLAAGNDSRFHTQNTDTGTTQTSFQLDSGNTGPRLKNSSGAVRLRNAADAADADLIVGNLTVNGTTTTINSETLTVDDNQIVLNNNVTSGTPTEDGGVLVRRGASTSASLLWDETNDIWKAGLAGSEVAIARAYRTSFNNAALSAGVLTVTHNLGQQYVTVAVYDNSEKQILPDEVTLSSTSALTVDLTSFGAISGTWNVVVTG